MKQPAVYILTNHSKTLYAGVTSNLPRRAWEHKEKLIEGFTKKYNIDQLVYYEYYETMPDAIFREKEIKGWDRQKKVVLIERNNPDWLDLYDGMCNEQ